MVGILLLALDEVVAAEFVIWLSTLQNMVGDYKDRMRDSDDGLVVSVTSFDPRVLRCKIGALGSCRSLRGFDQRRSQPLRAFARFARESLAGRLLVARAQTRPRRQISRRWKAAHVGADLGQKHLGGTAIDPGYRIEEINRRNKRGDHRRDVITQAFNGLIEIFEMSQQFADKNPVGWREPAGEGLA